MADASTRARASMASMRGAMARRDGARGRRAIGDARRARATRRATRLDAAARDAGAGGRGAGGDGDDAWWRGGGGGDDDDDGAREGTSKTFHAWVKFFAGATALNWTTREIIAWNDRPAHDAVDDDAWSRKRVSIVIPARNERKAIGPLLKRLRGALEPEAAEIVVSVGDSVDDTAAIAAAHGAIVVSGEKGRGNQMNAGARVATGDYVLFLHADTTPPTDVVDVVRRQLRDQKTVVGGFVSLIETSSRTFWAMSYHNVIKTTYCAVISRPFGYLRGFRVLFGDQAMFCRRDDFNAVGGFDGALCIMEDADLCARMHVKGRGRYRGRVKLVDRVVTTSGRRIERLGNFKATCIHVLIACSWNFGVGPERLRRLYDWCYRDVR
jgi:rSAM/selenodomain-associated transferase 2